MKVLFVCMSNIFRSQISEAVYNHYTHSKDAKSAGIMADVYDDIPSEVRGAVKELGIEMDDQKPKPLTQELMDEADLIIALDKRIPAEIPSYYSKKLKLWDTPDTSRDNGKRIREIRDYLIVNVRKLAEER